ncbi:hypothetical protein [Bacillus sp. T33-2]|uniref:hypothetical protein n=1 Tax=Bacillus sp. T33-2 TaxID=2054168 RepID=UPI000C76B960|nr:hypothetical protein [Bacillus sp. T33-2]PLR99495.1 hypothetical protein CVD19_00090 [Bacillus sp. T33-2]
MQYAHRKFLVTVNRVKEKGVLETYSGSIPVFPGDMILTDLDGNTFVERETRFNEYYVPVEQIEAKPKKKVNLDEMMKGYAEMGQLVKESNEKDENYIFEPNKAL